MGSPFQIELFRSEEGEWVEIVRWNSKEEAQQAMSIMDESSIGMIFLHPEQHMPTGVTG